VVAGSNWLRPVRSGSCNWTVSIALRGRIFIRFAASCR
jgi:hypothetical protein